MTGIVSDNVGTLTVISDKRIGGIFPDVTIEEQHSDDLVITEHPVMQGAQITDHAYKNPARVTMIVGWSDSSKHKPLQGGAAVDDIAAAYSYLLTLQASRQPFDIVTTKRAYSNMLLQSLNTVTDQQTNSVLRVVAVFRQIITVGVRAVTLATAKQAQPPRTGPVINNGTKQAKAVKTPTGATGRWSTGATGQF